MTGTLNILANQPIPTWFGVGGAAERLAIPQTATDLRECLRMAPEAKILGDGANLLVADVGVPGLVIACNSLCKGPLSHADLPLAGSFAEGDEVQVTVGAAAHLFWLINQTTNLGLAGLEVLAGIPACLGGAIAMNAGGKYGSIADCIVRVDALRRGGDRTGEPITLEHADCGFSYRHSLIAEERLVVTAATLRLHAVDRERLKARLAEITEYKKTTQPLSANSAGCAFKNPTLREALVIDHAPLGAPGQRISAGLLIDKAGCKGLRIGSAFVSGQHGNFIAADKGGSADDVLAVMRAVRQRVRERFGVELHNEVVIWGTEL